MPFSTSRTGGRAQRIADSFHIERLHRKLDEFAGRFCPIHRALGQSLSLERGPVRVRRGQRVP